MMIQTVPATQANLHYNRIRLSTTPTTPHRNHPFHLPPISSLVSTPSSLTTSTTLPRNQKCFRGDFMTSNPSPRKSTNNQALLPTGPCSLSVSGFRPANITPVQGIAPVPFDRKNQGYFNSDHAIPSSRLKLVESISSSDKGAVSFVKIEFKNVGERSVQADIQTASTRVNRKKRNAAASARFRERRKERERESRQEIARLKQELDDCQKELKDCKKKLDDCEKELHTLRDI